MNINWSAQFYKAAQSGNLPLLKEAVLGSNNQIKRSVVNAAFIEAVVGNYKDIVEYLLYSEEIKNYTGHNADINWENGRAVNWAINENLFDMAGYLVKNNANTELDNYYSFRLLMEYDFPDSLADILLETLKEDLQNKSELRDFFKDWLNSNNLHLKSSPYIENITNIINRYSEKDRLSQLLVSYAAQGNLEGINRLIEDNDALQGCYQEALLLGCYYGHLPVVKELVERGADYYQAGQIPIRKEQKYDKQAAFYISCNKAIPIALYLLEHEKTHINLDKLNKEYAFEKSLDAENIEFFNYLIDNGVELEVQKEKLLPRLRFFRYYKFVANIIEKIVIKEIDFSWDTEMDFMYLCGLRGDFERFTLILQNGGSVEKFLNVYDKKLAAFSEENNDYDDNDYCPKEDYMIDENIESWCRQYLIKKQDYNNLESKLPRHSDNKKSEIIKI